MNRLITSNAFGTKKNVSTKGVRRRSFTKKMFCAKREWAGLPTHNQGFPKDPPPRGHWLAGPLGGKGGSGLRNTLTNNPCGFQILMILIQFPNSAHGVGQACGAGRRKPQSEGNRAFKKETKELNAEEKTHVGFLWGSSCSN